MSARRSWPLAALALAAVFLLGAARPPDVEGLLRAGDDAYRRGDYGRAAELFERAGERATDPGLVAFNLAATKYQLALANEGNVALLREAEQLYSCCLRKGDPRRARALYGLGNCLLARGGAVALDAGALRAAADAYLQCLAEPGVPPELAADARHNLQRARLLLAQVPPAGEDDSPKGDDPDPKKED